MDGAFEDNGSRSRVQNQERKKTKDDDAWTGPAYQRWSGGTTPVRFKPNKVSVTLGMDSAEKSRMILWFLVYVRG